MRIPVLPHHNLVFGRVLHNTIHFYLKERMSGKRMTEEELLKEYDERWINEGFLSREHEEMRKKAGEKALLQPGDKALFSGVGYCRPCPEKREGAGKGCGENKRSKSRALIPRLSGKARLAQLQLL